MQEGGACVWDLLLIKIGSPRSLACCTKTHETNGGKNLFVLESFESNLHNLITMIRFDFF